MKKLFLCFLTALCMVWVASCGGGQMDEQSEATDTTAVDEGQAMTEAPATEAKTESAPRTEQKAEAPKPKQPTTVKVTLPESTAVRVALVDSIDSDVHKTGDLFKASLIAPIVIDGSTVFEAGAACTGVLDNVVESGRLKTPAELSFRLTSIVDASGKRVDVQTFAISEKKGGKTGRDVALIGGGAVVGGIIGKMTGEKGGTEIGAAAGAAAGTGVAAATGKDDIAHSAGTEVTFFVSSPLIVSVPR
jgi:hypothetical protein